MAADISVVRGSTFAYVLTIPPGQGIESLIGLTPSCELRSDTERLTLTAFVLSEAKRQVSISASAGKMAIPTGLYRFDLKLRNAGGLVRASYLKSCQVTDGVFNV